MRKKIFLLLSLLALNGIVSVAFAQTPGGAAKLSLATGDVVSINENKIVLQTKDGAIDVMLAANTEFKRVSPENPSLKTAVASAFSDIGGGDKLVVTGLFSEDKKTLPARSVYLMTKSDIKQKQATESEKWSNRGVSGRVVSVNPQTNQINIEMRGLASTSTIVLTPKPNAKFRRYAPNSVKFSEALVSSLTDVQAGDMLRALGDKSADGASFAAEEIISGAFQTVAGIVKSVDPANNEVVIADIQSKKDVTVALGSASMLKKIPEEMAQRMAMRQSGQASGTRPGGQGESRPQADTAEAGQGRRGGGAGRGGFGGRQSGGIDDMLERFPTITTGDLKIGDMIAVSSTKSLNADRITAIKLLAGIEPFVKAAAANGGERRDRQGGQSLSIPGLDALNFP